MMQSWLEIDAGALRSNLQAFAKTIGEKNLAPVLKSNAYGHGLSVVYEILAKEKLSWICVNYVFEAEKLRSLGFKGRLLVVGPTTPEEFSTAAQLKAEIVLISGEHLAAWMAAKKRPNGHIKIDTGMSRQGFLPDQVPLLIESLKDFKKEVVGISSHFANVEDVLEQEYANLQLARLQKAAASFKAAGFTLLSHIASSASSLIYEQSRLDLCRVGISLYGHWPSPATRLSYFQIHQKNFSLQPALSWKTRIAMVKPVLPGEFIGYGCSFRAGQNMRVAVLPVGYNEGYPRAAGNGHAYVLINGQRAPLVGRICMNMCMVDVTHIASAAAGDEVVLIGRSGKEYLDASDIATWAQTINYEILTRIHPDIPRLVVNDHVR